MWYNVGMITRKAFIASSSAALLSACTTMVPDGSRGSDKPRLKVRFLGTGAADWDEPDERGEFRRTSSVLLDDSVLIDFTEMSADMLPVGVRPRIIFYTHSHLDHYDPRAALGLGIERVYAQESWSADVEREFAEAAAELGVRPPVVTGLKFGVGVEVCGLRITSLPANHGTRRPHERSSIYLVEKGATRLLYATDTGGITAEAAKLSGIYLPVESEGITALIMEATMGVDYADNFRIYTHSSVATVAQLVRVLEMTERYHPAPGQKVYLTHMSREMHGTQREIERAVPDPLCPAYDGLEIML